MSTTRRSGWRRGVMSFAASTSRQCCHMDATKLRCSFVSSISCSCCACDSDLSLPMTSHISLCCAAASMGCCQHGEYGLLFQCAFVYMLVGHLRAHIAAGIRVIGVECVHFLGHRYVAVTV